MSTCSIHLLMYSLQGQGTCATKLKKTEHDIKEVQKQIDKKLGLALQNLWDLPVDRQHMGAYPLQVVWCTKINPVDPKKVKAAHTINPSISLHRHILSSPLPYLQPSNSTAYPKRMVLFDLWIEELLFECGFA
ncbi:hypothetical protein BDR06DRAFT_1072334 [Suillus hirtellus]|nr:hypothetical protein BDR06DRAFT_1072334 [Suillus hirtellus]